MSLNILKSGFNSLFSLSKWFWIFYNLMRVLVRFSFKIKWVGSKNNNLDWLYIKMENVDGCI